MLGHSAPVTTKLPDESGQTCVTAQLCDCVLVFIDRAGLPRALWSALAYFIPLGLPLRLLL